MFYTVRESITIIINVFVLSQQCLLKKYQIPIQVDEKNVQALRGGDKI